jgi:hypothetical protein
MARKFLNEPKKQSDMAPRRKYRFRKHDQFKKLSSVIRVIGPRKNIRFLIPVSKFSKVQLSKTLEYFPETENFHG